MQNWRVNLGERIDPDLSTPLYLQIIQVVVRDIESGRLPAGTFLPSSRSLAQILGVSRKTVVIAYDDLISQGWLTTEGTRGTMVSKQLPETKASAKRWAPAADASNRIRYAFAVPPERPLAIPTEAKLKIDEGAPDGRLFPPELLARALRKATLHASRSNNLQYRDPRGSQSLRRAIAEMLTAQRGLAVDEDNICITRGGQHGIFLAAMTTLRPGDAVIVEALTYEPAVSAFEAMGAEIITVGLDNHGMIVDDVAAICRERSVKTVFATPHHQFPTTVALSPERRLQLVDLAREYAFAIIEDDYDHEFHFESQPLLPIAAYAPGETVYVGSLSKLLLPALRVGYIAAPPKMIDTVAHMVSLTDGMGNTIVENAASALISNGEMRRHSRKVKQIYADRRERFARELDSELGDRAIFKIPDGGLAFWVEFNGDLNQIEKHAVADGLRFASHKSYMTRTNAARGLRLGFASLDEEETRIAVSALAKASR
ncbi:MocR-like pyridoxine biosynthesis transcription factor PdxR [Hyphococcus lacteus]|uniref:PLP-dependent aminotransferase family protein n=1 Tax=Hyphococcus lacteus TaxID=3143536 RepID=A0ABV3Z7I5_9PROT